MSDYIYRVEYHQKKNRYKNLTKEERAKDLNNIICPFCKYQNHYIWIKKFGRCNLCKCTLDKGYFKKEILRRLKNEK